MANRQQGIKEFSSEFGNKQTFPSKYNAKFQKIYLLQQTFIDPGGGWGWGVSVETSCLVCLWSGVTRIQLTPWGLLTVSQETNSFSLQPSSGWNCLNKLKAGGIFVLCLMYVCERRKRSPLPGGRLEINGQWQTSRQWVVLATTLYSYFKLSLLLRLIKYSSIFIAQEVIVSNISLMYQTTLLSKMYVSWINYLHANSTAL